MALEDNSDSFQFNTLPSSLLGSIRNKSKGTLELLEKWGLTAGLKFATFSYNKHYQSYLKDTFVLNFFQSIAVNSTLETLSSGGRTSTLSLAKEIDSVLVEDTPCTVLNMEFFDRLWKCGVVRESGQIVKCYDEVHGDFVISDELRKMLLDEESEHYEEFSKGDREEFIFRLFQHLQLGGPVNQYEDDIQPYLDTCKLLYKEMVIVVKDMNTKSLSIASTVLQVYAKVKGEIVFPGRGVTNEQTFCYLIIDNIKRLVTVFYHMWN